MVTTWTDLTLFCSVEEEKDEPYVFIYVWNLKPNRPEQEQTDPRNSPVAER